MEDSLNPADSVFACRLCLGLTYRNRQTGRFMSRAYEWDDKGLAQSTQGQLCGDPEGLSAGGT